MSGRKNKKERKEQGRYLENTVTIVVGEMISDYSVTMADIMTTTELTNAYCSGLSDFNRKKHMNLSLSDFALRPNPAKFEAMTWKSFDEKHGFITMILSNEQIEIKPSVQTLSEIDRIRLERFEEVSASREKSIGEESDSLARIVARLVAQQESTEIRFVAQGETIVAQGKTIAAQEKTIAAQEKAFAALGEIIAAQGSQIHNLLANSAILNQILRRKLIFEVRQKVIQTSTLSDEAQIAISTLSDKAKSFLYTGTQQGNIIARDDVRDAFEIRQIALAVTAAQENSDLWGELFSFMYDFPASSVVDDMRLL
jgi:hypothetical protein